MKQPLALVYNPTAGGGRWRPSIDKVVRALEDAGGEVEMFPTRAAGDGVEQARLASLQHKVVAVYGGDGSVNEALNGIVASGASPRVLILPGGTMNVLCRDLRIPLNAVKAAALLAGGVAKRIYLGRAGQRYFSLMAGVGLDAAVVHGMSEHAGMKRAIGPLAFLLTGWWSMWRYRYPAIDVEIDGAHYTCHSLIVGKSRGYGGWMSVTDRADPGQPMFEVALGESPGALWHTANVSLAFIERMKWSPNHRFFLTSRLSARSTGDAHVQIDGDAAGVLPMEFAIDGTSVEVLVPRSI